MALAVYSRSMQHPPAATEASSKYHRLLQVAQERIAQVGFLPTLDERNIEACLLAVFLMGRYEGAIHRPGDPNSNDAFTWSHHDGAMAILKVWNDNLSHNPANFIIKQTRRGLIRCCLLRNLPLPDWMLDGIRFGEHDLELNYDRIFVRIVNLHYASASLQQKNGLQITKAEMLNNEARELDKALQDWVVQFPSTWSYQRHVLTEPDDLWPRRHFYSSIVYSYSKPGYATVWSQYFAARMLINSTRLRVLDLSPPNPLADFTYEHQRLECITQLKSMAGSLASTIPFCLERFKVANNPNSPICQTSVTLNTNEEIKPYLASLAVWPLSIATSLEGIDARQQQWFRSELARLGRITGSGVLEYAETDQWTTL
ncbi:hypothetical protein MMC28_010431 [Mycoblastus sanguinarius]|nr:hypothetical protein [Mycoblastus sanguinarius]